MNIKIYKRILCGLLAGAIVILAGCNSSSPSGGNTGSTGTAASDGTPAADTEGGAEEEAKAEPEKPVDDGLLSEDETDCPYEYSDETLMNIKQYTNLEEYYIKDGHLDPDEVYENITYTPQMFYGDYGSEDFYGPNDTEMSEESDGFKNFVRNIKWQTIYDYSTQKDREVSTVPIGLRAGRNWLGLSLFSNIKKYNWMELTFLTKGSGGSYYGVDIIGAYYVEDGRLYFTPLRQMETGKDENGYTIVTQYALCDTTYDYSFEFTGKTLTLSKGESQKTLTAKGLSDKLSKDNLALSYGYAHPSDNKIDNIAGFNIAAYPHPSEDSESRFTIVTDDGGEYLEDFDNGVGHFQDNGILNFSWADNDGTRHAYEFVYFYCDIDGLILTDGENMYSYIATYKEYMLGGIPTSDDKAVEGFKEDTAAAVLKKKKSLIEELMKAFEAEGISVEYNDETGEMMLDSKILFAVDKYDLSTEGKDYLKKFIKAYSSVILKDDYEGFVSEIMVEGHTDSTGERSHNEELSKKRAEEVMKYCLSSEVGMDSAAQTEMGKLMKSVGYADDYPILDISGKENAEKSRRVSFKFTIDADNAAQLTLAESDTDTQSE